MARSHSAGAILGGKQPAAMPPSLPFPEFLPSWGSTCVSGKPFGADLKVNLIQTVPKVMAHVCLLVILALLLS